MKLFAAAGFVLSGLMATSALAATQDGPWYAGMSGDVTFPRNTSVTGSTTGDINYKFSSGTSFQLGYEPQALNTSFGDARFELEGGYYAFGIKNITANGVTNNDPHGDLKTTTMMGNMYYDFHTNTAFTPYIGAGVGGANIAMAKNNGLGMTKGSDNELAYQFMAGVSYTPPSMPKTDWLVGYHYLGTTSPQFATSTGNVSFDSIQASNIEVGFRYHF